MVELTIELPEEIERELRAAWENLTKSVQGSRFKVQGIKRVLTLNLEL
jgi:hypothetical protein